MNEINLTQILLAVIGFLIVYVLNGIKGEIVDIKKTINVLETDLRGGMSGLDRRVTVMETRCTVNHGNQTTNEG